MPTESSEFWGCLCSSLFSACVLIVEIHHPLYSQAKDEENSGNHYNHNFNGCYCTCDRPYPDTDDQVAYFGLCKFDHLDQACCVNLHQFSQKCSSLIGRR